MYQINSNVFFNEVQMKNFKDYYSKLGYPSKILKCLGGFKLCFKEVRSRDEAIVFLRELERNGINANIELSSAPLSTKY
jgi:hypothetical protein